MAQLNRRGQVLYTPLFFLELLRLNAEVDVNIVPLVKNALTNCKLELNFFKDAIVDRPIMATPIYMYAKCIKDRVNGFLCRLGQWYRAIENNNKSEVYVSLIIRNAHEDAIREYSGDIVIIQFEEFYGYFYGTLKNA